MKKNKLLKIVNILLFAAVFAQFVNIVLQKFITSDSIISIHEWLGYSIGVLIAFHVALNWGWIKSNISSKKNAKGPLS
jgi:hypothetical protein